MHNKWAVRTVPVVRAVRLSYLQPICKAILLYSLSLSTVTVVDGRDRFRCSKGVNMVVIRVSPMHANCRHFSYLAESLDGR